jgi:phage-related protein
MATKDIDILIKAHDKASREIKRVEKSLNSLTKSTARAMADTEKLQAGAIAGLAVLATSYAQAGAGAVAFGSVAVSALNDVFSASEQMAKAQEMINNGKVEEGLKLQAKAMENLSKEQQRGLKSLTSFKKFWSEFTKQFEKPVVDTFIKGLETLKSIIKVFAPIIEPTAQAIQSLLDSLNEKVNSQQMEKFVGWLQATMVPTIENLGKTVGNFIMGFMNLLVALNPVTKQVQSGMLGLSEGFLAWSQSLQKSKGFQKFISFIKTNAPKVIDIIGNIIEVGMNIAKVLAPAITVALTVFQKLTNHTDLLTAGILGLVGAFTAFKVINTVIKGVRILKSLMIAMRAGTVMATLAQWGFNTALLASPITWIVVAIGVLIGVIYLLYKNWDTVSAFLIQSWNKIKAVGMALWYGFSAWLKGLWNSILSFLKGIWAMLKKTGIKLIQSLITGILNRFNQIMHIKNIVLNAFNNVKDAIWNGIRSAWRTVLGFASNFKNAGYKLISTFAQGIRNAVGSAVSAVSGVLDSVRQFLPFSDAKKGALSDLTYSGGAMLTAFAKGMKAQQGALNSAVGSAMQTASMSLNTSINPAPSSFRNEKPQNISIGNGMTIIIEGGKDMDEDKLADTIMERMYREL